jgi:DNA-binding transcriptional MerR regulator
MEKLSSKPSDQADSPKVYRIGELAKITNSTTRTLRFYEEINLIQPIRNTSGQRVYSQDAIVRLNFIHELKSGGFSLQEIKSFFESWDGRHSGGEAAAASVELIKKKLVEIAELQKKISNLNHELKSMVNYLLACKGCDGHPAAESCAKCERHPDEPANPLLVTILKRD